MRTRALFDCCHVLEFSFFLLHLANCLFFLPYCSLTCVSCVSVCVCVFIWTATFFLFKFGANGEWSWNDCFSLFCRRKIINWIYPTSFADKLALRIRTYIIKKEGGKEGRKEGRREGRREEGKQKKKQRRRQASKQTGKARQKTRRCKCIEGFCYNLQMSIYHVIYRKDTCNIQHAYSKAVRTLTILMSDYYYFIIILNQNGMEWNGMI